MLVSSYPTQVNYSNIIQSQGPSQYMGELMELYNRYLYEEKVNKLLARKIEEVNHLIDVFVQDREKKSYTLFCTEKYDEALSNISDLKEKSEFLVNALSFVLKFIKDRKTKKLIESSIEVIQSFIIKLIDFASLYQDLKSFEGEIDEDSEAYNSKMEQIVEYVSSTNKRKVGNSLRELLAI